MTADHDAAVPLRVLIALHGYEPPGWAGQTCRLISTWVRPTLRVLAVLDVPAPPFTSLTGAARRAYGAARARWTDIERARLDGHLAALMRGLPGEPEVVRASAMRGDLARTIAEQARRWPAELVVVGGPASGLHSWLRPGPVHERVLRLAPCAVLVTAASRVEERGIRRLVVVPRTTPAVIGDRL